MWTLESDVFLQCLRNSMLEHKDASMEYMNGVLDTVTVLQKFIEMTDGLRITVNGEE